MKPGPDLMEINRFFLFNPQYPIRRILEIYILQRLSQGKKNIRGCDIKEELIRIFCSAWVPSNKPLYHVLHQMEEEGLLQSVWVGKNGAQDSRYYHLTDLGARTFRKRLPQAEDMYKQAIQCLETTLKALFPAPNEKHKAVSPTHSPMFNTTLFVELMILLFAKHHEDWFTSTEAHQALDELYKGTYVFADTQMYNRFNHLTVRGYLTARKMASNDANTYEKNRSPKEYHITTNGIAHLRQMQGPEMGFYARIQAVLEGMKFLREGLHHLYSKDFNKKFSHISLIK